MTTIIEDVCRLAGYGPDKTAALNRLDLASTALAEAMQVCKDAGLPRQVCEAVVERALYASSAEKKRAKAAAETGKTMAKATTPHTN